MRACAVVLPGGVWVWAFWLGRGCGVLMWGVVLFEQICLEKINDIKTYLREWMYRSFVISSLVVF